MYSRTLPKSLSRHDLFTTQYVSGFVGNRARSYICCNSIGLMCLHSVKDRSIQEEEEEEVLRTISVRSAGDSFDAILVRIQDSID